MISCIVLDQTKGSDTIVKNVLDDHLNGVQMISSKNIDNKTIIFIHNIDKIKVWQVVFNFEVQGIKLGYGFGSIKEAAKEQALDRLKVVKEEVVG